MPTADSPGPLPVESAPSAPLERAPTDSREGIDAAAPPPPSRAPQHQTPAFTPPPKRQFPDPIPGRGRFRSFVLDRLRASPLLQGCMVLAFLCYGAMPVMLFWHADSPAIRFWFAMMIVMSLASWTLLFHWYPVLEETQKALGNNEKGRMIGGVLESLAIGCVVVVHVLMAISILRQAGIGL